MDGPSSVIGTLVVPGRRSPTTVSTGFPSSSTMRWVVRSLFVKTKVLPTSAISGFGAKAVGPKLPTMVIVIGGGRGGAFGSGGGTGPGLGVGGGGGLYGSSPPYSSCKAFVFEPAFAADALRSDEGETSVPRPQAHS